MAMEYGAWTVSYPVILFYFSDSVGSVKPTSDNRWISKLNAEPFSDGEDMIIGTFNNMKEAADALWSARYSANVKN